MLLFLCIMAIADISLGSMLSFMLSHANGGNNDRINYICDQTNEEMLIFGSSRADHHYNPQILMDSLNMTVYNCGEDGNGIILNYGRLLMIKQRYLPKVIIYEVTKSFDLEINDNHKYIGKLKPYYNRDGIQDIFVSVDKTERWKMMSQLYKYNSSFLTVIADYLHPIRSMGFQGFRPLQGEMDSLKISSPKDEKPKVEFDPLKLGYIEMFINSCKDVKLIFAFSPIWYGLDTERLKPVIDICQEHGIPFIDFSNDPKYVHNNAYFKDGSHLNARGADEFTRDLIRELKNRGIMN